MGRTIAGILLAMAAWMVIALGAGAVMRQLWTAYAAAAATMAFTGPMLGARLALGALATGAAGAVAARVAPRSRWVAWSTGVALLVLFVPQHVTLWAVFPVWYHVLFLASLVPLCGLGGRLLHTVGDDDGQTTR